MTAAARTPVHEASQAKGTLQRCGAMPCSGCDHEQESPLMRTRGFGNEPEAVPPIVGEVLRSGGLPLDTETRGFFEQRLGHDFSRVRVHTDGRAAESARAVNAVAYTVGRDLVFGTGAYETNTEAGRRILAHELTHVVQQGDQGGAYTGGPLRLGGLETAHEQEAHAVGDTLARERRAGASSAAGGVLAGTVQRFSSQEHADIGNAAYERAKPADQSGPANGAEPQIDPSLVPSLRSYQYKRATGATMTYGKLVAAGDDFASLAEMERRDRAKAGEGVRVPVLSYIWDKIDDTTHYLDLAARNVQHFHPHNFMAWQKWQWTALRVMDAARVLTDEARTARGDLKDAMDKFSQHEKLARKAAEHLDSLAQDERSDALDKILDVETGSMEKLLAEATEKKKVADVKTGQAISRAQRAVTINGFGNHFLTDAYAAGHIVTPRADLLKDFSTKLLGVVETGGVLNCASAPSLAWHDLDNAFGVQVSNMNKEQWLTYGDDYADTDALPGGKSLSPTKEHAVDATSTSLKQLWEAAAGPKPTSLSPVLNKLPRPDLDKYPRWTPEQWSVQLRYSAGEPVGADFADALGEPRSGTPAPKEQVPNPKGAQLGASVLSVRATCGNLLSVFSYDKFVTPMLQRIKSEYSQRFYSGSSAQTVSPDAVPKPQDSVVGHTVAGSLLGGLSGVLLGLAIGGPVGAVIGGLIGLFGGGFIGGLIGSKRSDDEPAV